MFAIILLLLPDKSSIADRRLLEPIRDCDIFNHQRRIFRWKYYPSFVSLDVDIKGAQEFDDMEINELLVSFIVLYMMLSAVALIPPTITKTRYWVTWWDYVFPLLGMPLWFILRGFHIGDDISTTNFAFEVFFILILSVATPWMRYYLAYCKAKIVAYLSFSLTFLPILTTFLLRMTVPLLPT